jgi:NOL1/NOP2/sun family putative RNA methylase
VKKLPEAFVDKMRGLLDEEYTIFMECYNNPPCQGLRVNTLKIEEEDFVSLAPFELNPVPWAEGGFYYSQQDRPGKHPYYYAGLYYIQEPSAMAPAELLGVTPGHKVLDLCAAPGGKSFQIAAHLKGEGFLIANEINASRVLVLGENLERLGVTNVAITQETPDRLAAVFKNYFDRILVDAPCSGEGMFRKSPEMCSMWSPTLPGRFSTRQKNILGYAAQMLAPGGRMVYSTCTFSPEENEGVVEWFLKQHHDFFLVNEARFNWFDSGVPEWVNGSADIAKTYRLWPHKIRGEGHFMALFEKKPEGKSGSLPLFYKRRGINKPPYEYECFMKDYMKEFIGDYLYLHKDQLYRIPPSLPDLSGFRVLRPGFNLGTVKKGRFIPSHALAMASKKGSILPRIDMSSCSNEVMQYLEGFTLTGYEGKGWVLVTVDGYALGWAKLSDGLLKNYYPKGLRRILT